jgi:hypothetical protein
VKSSWKATPLTSVDEVSRVLSELRGKRWLCRGQSKQYGALVPSIDREPRQHLSRAQKLTLERQSIDLFRSTARYFADPGEQGALHDDIVALMVLRHYGVATRLLDWSWSPWVAAHFAVEKHDTEDGEVWTFDEPHYENEGKGQWRKWPETTSDGTGDPDKFGPGLTAFRAEEPPDWFICGFYRPGFPRQNAQDSVYTMTARFGRTHDAAITDLLVDSARFHRYTIPASMKPKLREHLREYHGIWRGALFPDSAGAAETAGAVFYHGG